MPELNETSQVEESQEPQAHGGTLKRKKYPTYFGFDGRYRKMEELRPRLADFKRFYSEKRFAPDGGKLSAMKIVDQFNEMQPEGTRDFWPKPTIFAMWRKRWDTELMGLSKKAVENVESQAIEPAQPVEMETLEQGAHTLAEELLIDAKETLRDTREREELFEDEVVVKRKQYALNVFNFVIRASHSKQALDIKRRAESRETAGFLIDLMRKAHAGKLTDAEKTLIRGSVSQKHGQILTGAQQVS